MLKTLTIKNYALIQELEIHPDRSLNIITGETGAGKSIMLGALGLLQGNRADTKVLYDESSKCIVEGAFDVSEYQLEALFEELELDYEQVSYLRREITPSGKSRAFVNDTPVRLDALRKITTYLMDIHSQHDTILLGENNFQLTLVDAYAQNEKVKKKYQKAYKAYQKAEKAYNNLLLEYEKTKSDYDYNSHILNELTEANLDELDIEELESEIQVAENAEAITQNLNFTLETLSSSEFSVEQNLKSVTSALSQIENLSPKYANLKERIDSTLIELMDVISEVEKEEGELFFDQEKVQLTRDQLDKVYALQKKHRLESLEELVELRESIQQKVNAVENFDDELASLEDEKNKCYEEVINLGNKLSESRENVTGKIEQEIYELLKDLGMPNSQMDIQQQTIAPSPQGTDEITFLFSANKGITPQSLKNVASGGELSRLMLSLKYILASRTSLPTIIFDEIDTGISGEIAIKVGKMMKTMAKNHQLIAISHLPQMAAQGHTHYFVYKDNSAEKSMSRIKKLSVEERINEIAQMIGGQNPSKTAFESAKELMRY